jgi:hypothetical protein
MRTLQVALGDIGIMPCHGQVGMPQEPVEGKKHRRRCARTEWQMYAGSGGDKHA